MSAVWGSNLDEISFVLIGQMSKMSCLLEEKVLGRGRLWEPLLALTYRLKTSDDSFFF